MSLGSARDVVLLLRIGELIECRIQDAMNSWLQKSEAVETC
jgi:hypothetical protein